MALKSVKEILHMADQANTSVIAFICIDYNMVYSVVKMAEKTNTPAIVMLLPEHHCVNNTFGIQGFMVMAKELVRSVKVPIGIHLDHSYDYESIVKAIQGGFPSIMIDGSAKPLEENIALTKKVTETAHIFGVDVEAELGHVGMALDSDGDKKEFYTQPETAEHFCKETGIDSLTISIGNAHGIYMETPHLDLKRLEEIDAATDVPLVLHGGSGIPDAQLKEAFTKGINKFNVGTEFLGVYYDAIAAYTKAHEKDENAFKMLEVPMFAQAKMEEYLEVKLKFSRF